VEGELDFAVTNRVCYSHPAEVNNVREEAKKGFSETSITTAISCGDSGDE
jgi:hypothetical protein